MGKISTITKEQEIILDEIRKCDFFKEKYYFTGGTALSEIYLQHRYSEDLDFFSYDNPDIPKILEYLYQWSKKYKFTYRTRKMEYVIFASLKFKNTTLKIDFAKYPYKQLEKGKTWNDLSVDSLLDIAVNKLSLLSQRTEIKDYVDLYFLLERFSVWDLIDGVRIKFNMEIEPFLLASDFTNVEKFENLPRMLKSLSLSHLKHFFRQKAIEIGGNKILRF